MFKKMCKVVVTMAVLVGLLLMAVGCPAQVVAPPRFPTGPFTNVVVFSPGGTTDLQQRVLQEFWKAEFGHPMVLTYITGAGGQLGWDAYMGMPADGYTIAPNNLPHILIQPIMRATVYTTEDHIRGAIAGLVIDPVMIAVREDSPFKDFSGLIEYVRKNPGGVTAGIVGKFTGDWLDLKRLEALLDIDLAEVAFPGSADVVASLLGGHIDIKLGNVGCIMRADPAEYRILVVGFPEMPAILVPILDKVGNPPLAAKYGIDWGGGIPRGLWVHPNTPAYRKEILRRGVWNIITSEAYARRMFEVGLPMHNQTHEEYAEFIRRQKEDVVRVLVDLGYVEVVGGKVRRISP